MHEKVRVPGLHACGWFDHLTRGQYEAYCNIRDRGATREARAGQRLVIGPWGDQTVGISGERHGRYGDWAFGPQADFPLLASELQFLDFHLKDDSPCARSGKGLQCVPADIDGKPYGREKPPSGCYAVPEAEAKE